MKYTRKDTTIDAWTVTDILNRWNTHGADGLPESVLHAYDDGRLDFPSALIGTHDLDRIDVVTHHGLVIGNHGAWLIRGPEGEFYICRADIFADAYTLQGKETPA